MSRLEGPGLTISAAEIAWENGEREVRGWDRHGSSPMLEDVVGRLRIGIHWADRYESQSSMELRVAVEKSEGQASVLRISDGDLSKPVGFDVVGAFDRLTESVVGIREVLVKDSGPRRGQLCVVFDSTDRVSPVLAWAFTRPSALLLVDLKRSRPTSPIVQRKPPRLEEMQVDHSSLDERGLNF